MAFSLRKGLIQEFGGLYDDYGVDKCGNGTEMRRTRGLYLLTTPDPGRQCTISALQLVEAEALGALFNSLNLEINHDNLLLLWYYPVTCASGHASRP